MKNSVTDMTVGSPSRHILIFALPLFIGNIFQQFYNMVDSIIVGNYVGKNAIAAVGTCGSMGFFCFSLSAGLSIGIGIIVAQYYGAKNYKMVRATIGSSIFVLTGASLIVSVLAFLFCPYILLLLQCPKNILPDAVLYMRTTLCGLIFVAWYNGVASILRALGDSKSPLYFLIAASIINLLLDLLFVLVFNLGVLGVAIATCISQAVSAIASIIYAYKKIDYFRLTKEELRPHRNIIISSLRIGTPVALQSCLISISMMVLQGIVNTFGENIMAAYTIVMRVEQLVQQPYSSIGSAITNFSGQNIGAGFQDRVKKGFWQGTLIVLIFSLIMFPLFWFFGENIIGIFLKAEEGPDVVEVIRIGAKALKITCVCYFMLGMIYVPRAILNGCGDSGFAMINGVTEVIGRIGFAPVLTRIPKIGFWGIWLTTGITWTITSIVCVLRYKSGIWKRKAIVSK